ncbi:MAG: Uma2 family endonuclease [Bacteroidetes bacterium]|nr:MAG: Uma2 family endonuclease [Bacteroidota bacterium]
MHAALTTPPRRRKKVPSYLVYEVMDGTPLYYKGYKDVLCNKKTPEEIMGASSLQAVLISYIMQTILQFLNTKVYRVLVSEPGLHIDHRNNLSGDLLIYHKQTLTPSKINTHYADVPAFIHIEVDIAADLNQGSDHEYVSKKINKLHAFGTHKVIWVFTASQKVLVAHAGQDWLWIDWNKTVEIMEGHGFCIGQYLAAEGITI